MENRVYIITGSIGTDPFFISMIGKNPIESLQVLIANEEECIMTFFDAMLLEIDNLSITEKAEALFYDMLLVDGYHDLELRDITDPYTIHKFNIDEMLLIHRGQNVDINSGETIS